MSWRRVAAKFPENRTFQESFGQDLVIKEVQFDDKGEYECQGFNEEAIVPITSVTDLKVECKNIIDPLE